MDNLWQSPNREWHIQVWWGKHVELVYWLSFNFLYICCLLISFFIIYLVYYLYGYWSILLSVSTCLIHYHNEYSFFDSWKSLHIETYTSDLKPIGPYCWMSELRIFFCYYMVDSNDMRICLLTLTFIQSDLVQLVHMSTLEGWKSYTCDSCLVFYVIEPPFNVYIYHECASRLLRYKPKSTMTMMTI